MVILYILTLVNSLDIIHNNKPPLIIPFTALKQVITNLFNLFNAYLLKQVGMMYVKMYINLE